MTENYQIGDRVQIRIKDRRGGEEHWFSGTIVRIEPYSTHRSFHWVELDEEDQMLAGIREISVFNPNHIRKI